MEPFSALLISNDAAAVGVTGKILDEYNVRVDVIKTAPDMAKLMQHRRYDLAVYDHDVPGATELASLHWVRNRPRLAMALVGGGRVKELKGKPIHLVVSKPFTHDLFIKSIRAAYSLIVKDRRTAFRCPVQVEASSTTLVFAGGGRPLENIKVVDISQSGVRIQAGESLAKGALLAIDFWLPETKKLVRTKGTIVWSDESGKAGIKFGEIPALDRQNLCDWLSARIPPDPELALKPGTRRPIVSLSRQSPAFVAGLPRSF
jgi:CheY-like chemotaxis protein